MFPPVSSFEGKCGGQGPDDQIRMLNHRRSADGITPFPSGPMAAPDGGMCIDSQVTGAGESRTLTQNRDYRWTVVRMGETLESCTSGTTRLARRRVHDGLSLFLHERT